MAILTKFMGKDAEDSDKFEAGFAFCRTKLNRARGEERRKVYIHALHIMITNTCMFII